MNGEGASPTITRLRYETRRRRLTVVSAQRITPNMLRVRLEGAELDGFCSPDPGDHIKLMLPDGANGTVMRDYTPRRFNPEAMWLEIDFALHDAGPATRWAVEARPGDTIEIGGPRGSSVIAGTVHRWLLIGDETALPSIARRVEGMEAGTAVTSLVAISAPADQQEIVTSADHLGLWAVRSDPADPTDLLALLGKVTLGPEIFVWIGAEAGVARAIRDAVLAQGVAPRWTKAVGYWTVGSADTSAKDLAPLD